MTITEDFVIIGSVIKFLKGDKRRKVCKAKIMTGLKNFFKNLKIKAPIFIILTLIYFEIITKILTCGTFFDTGLIFMPVFSICFGLLISAPTAFMSEKAAKIFTAVTLSVIAFVHIAQIVYFSVFNKYLIFYSVTAGGVGNVLEGGIITTTLKSILGGVPAMLAFSVPIILLCRFGNKRITFSRILLSSSSMRK